jgi:hypothetical protein
VGASRPRRQAEERLLKIRSEASRKIIVIPAKAGIHLSKISVADERIPAFAGMTVAGLEISGPLRDNVPEIG